MIKKLLSLAVLSAISTGAFAQDTSIPKFNQDFKVSAKIDPGCFLEADNINFGVLATPIQDQSASSNMRIHCSKGAPLSIAINYGSTMVGTRTQTYSLSAASSGNVSGAYTYYTITGSSTGPISTVKGYDIECWAKYTGQLLVHSVQAKQLLGLAADASSHQTDKWGACSGGSIRSSFNINNYAVGETLAVLNGITSGEKIKFSLETPQNSGLVWNENNKHSVSGTGEQQVISMKANIKRSQNSTYRMTPDTYSSTLTVVLTY